MKGIQNPSSVFSTRGVFVFLFLHCFKREFSLIFLAVNLAKMRDLTP